jgi:LysM repeat protein
VVYTVVSGDTFYGIAEVFGVDAEELAAANDLTLTDPLQPGQVLVIPPVVPAVTPAASPDSPGLVTYTVAAGNTLYGIADLFGVDAEELAAANGLTLADFLHPGDVLVIPQ